MAEYTRGSIKKDSCHMDKKEEFVGMLKENQNKSNIKQEGKKLPQYVCAIVASIGAFIIGSVLAWTSPSMKYLKDENSTAPVHIHTIDEENWIAAWTPIAAILGALPAGFIADLLGRKMTLIIFTVPWIGTWAMLIFAQNVIMIYASRFISGVITGLFCAVLPMYVNEISEDSIRGSLGVLFQVFLTLGILYDYALSSLNSYSRLCEACGAVSILFFVVLFYIPESPIYLMKKNRKPEAEKSLRRLRGPYYDIHVELNELRKNLENSAKQSSSSGSMFTPVYIRALIIALGLMLAQQLSGINGVIFFAEQIFTDAGASSPALCTTIMGIVQTLITVLSSALVDRAGRRILLLLSSTGMGIALAVLGYYFKLQADKAEILPSITWLPLVCLVFFIIAFSLGIGPLPWMMSGEVLAPEIKSFGSGMAVATNWICVSLVTFFFKPLTLVIGSAAMFWIFSVIAFGAVVFILFIVPETKGKSMQEIQNELAGKKSKPHLNGNA